MTALERAWIAARDSRPGISLAAVLLINGGLILWTAIVTLQDFPNSGDEYAYRLSAALFAEGRLWVESPQPMESFSFHHVVNNGRYYGKYPPGWPLLLAGGVLAGVPWLVNPLLSLLTLVVLHRIGRENFGPGVANATLYATVANPFFIFNSASYFSHASCMLFLALSSLLALRGLRDATSIRTGALLGLCAGAAFCIRPYSSAAFLLPLGVALLARAVGPSPRLPRLRCAASAAAAFCVFLALMGTYNHLQTGNALTQPYSAYDARDGLGRTPTSHDWSWGFQANVLDRTVELNRWIPLCALSVIAYAWMRRRSGPPLSVGLLLAGFGSLALAYVAFLYSPGNQYGPRYVYEGSFALFLATGFVLASLRASALPLVAILLFLNGAYFATRSDFHAEQVRGRKELYECVQRQGVSRAVIFLKTGSGTMDPRDLTRNGIHFAEEPVLYVLDLGNRLNQRVLENYPDRTPYYFVDGGGEGRGKLIPYP